MSALVVVGLLALAVPAIVSTVETVSPYAPTAARAVDADGVSEAESTVDPAVEITAEEPAEPVRTPTPDGTHGDCVELSYPEWGDTRAPVDSGPREFAMGEVGFVDGIPTTYTVAPGDAIQGIGTRFCVFGTHLFYFNDVHLQGTIYPGDVLRLRP